MATNGCDVKGLLPSMEKFFHESSADMEKFVIGTKYSQFLTVYVQDESIPNMPKQTFITVHDINCNQQSLMPFVNCEYMDRVRERSRWVHVVMPGHDHGDYTLPESYEYPTLDQLGSDLADVLDELCISTVIGFGEGAGANVLVRFGLQHPNRCLGLILVDLIADPPSLTENMQSNMSKCASKGNKLLDKLVRAGPENQGDQCSSTNGINSKNLHKYSMAYVRRSSLHALLVNGLDAEVLLLVSRGTSKVNACKKSLKSMNMLRTTLMLVDGTADLLSDKEYQAARALVLFCKSCGVLLGIPMFGLEKAFERVNQQIASNNVEQSIAQSLIANENRLLAFLNGEDEATRRTNDSELPTYESLFATKN